MYSVFDFYWLSFDDIKADMLGAKQYAVDLVLFYV